MYTSSRLNARPVVFLAVLLLAAGALTSCGGPAISTFDETAYQKATSLKVESLDLMDAATDPYAEHADSVLVLKKRLEKAYEYAKGRPNNEISAQQWDILTDEDRNLLGGFLRRWEEKSPAPMNDSLIALKKEQVADAFDTIIELESGKIKPENARVVK